MNTTTCPKCGALYEESSEEQANTPSRECMTCWQERRHSNPEPRGMLTLWAAEQELL